MSDEEARKTTVQQFPETAKQVLEYYKTKATDEEKKVIAQAVRQTARAIKQEMRGEDGEEGKKKKKRQAMGQPSPEAVAAALYGILSQDKEANVDGDPRNGDDTLIEGEFDLNEVARKLLSLS